MKHYTIIKRISLMFIIASIMSSCYYDSEEYLYPGSACDTTNITFSGTVLPIITSCNSCHNSNLANGGVITENHAGLINSVNSGIFWKSINHESGALAMPQNGLKLPACDLLKVRTWINQGAPNN